MLLLTTTTVTIAQPAGGGDPYEAAVLTVVAAGVPANVTSPTGRDARVGGDQELVDALLTIDTTPVLDRTMRVTDDVTGELWDITWCRRRTGLGLDHQVAGLVAVKGGSNG